LKRRPPYARSLAGLIAALAVLCALPGNAAAGSAASSSSGGAMARERPVVQQLVCAEGRTARCGSGQVLKLRGTALADVAVVIFRGGTGGADDRTAQPTEASPRRILVQVPVDAKTGRVQVRSPDAGVSRSGPVLKVAPLPVLRAQAGLVGPATFPIAGPHEIGMTVTQRFGGPRGHQGQDVFAKCGTPLVAAQGGVVQHVDYEGRAGNYIVIALPDGTSEAYMHMAEPSPLEQGDAVAAGQPIGNVGDTGDAEGCHLHFELWTAPGWYEGGEPVDPLPLLQSLPGA
jgi:murein DD-endopeptidase MepM/ murein hydrolase activator NlpD